MSLQYWQQQSISSVDWLSFPAPGCQCYIKCSKPIDIKLFKTKVKGSIEGSNVTLKRSSASLQRVQIIWLQECLLRNQCPNNNVQVPHIMTWLALGPCSFSPTCAELITLRRWSHLCVHMCMCAGVCCVRSRPCSLTISNSSFWTMLMAVGGT